MLARCLWSVTQLIQPNQFNQRLINVNRFNMRKKRMKLNYLSIALATALATTLTACGSDNSSNYNQPTVSPAPHAKPGNDAGTNKPGNDAGTNKPAEDNKKPEGDANKKPDGDAAADKKPEGDANKKPEGDANKKPEAPQPEDKKINPGNAANAGDITTDNFVVAQNYIRGAASAFDKTNNPDKIGNASVVGFNELKENPYMSNIVLGRVRAKDGKKLTNYYAGEQADQVHNNGYAADSIITRKNGEKITVKGGYITGLQPQALQNLNDTEFFSTSGLFNAAVNNPSSPAFNSLKDAVDNANKAYTQAAIKAAALEAAAKTASTFKDLTNFYDQNKISYNARAAAVKVANASIQVEAGMGKNFYSTKAYKEAHEIANSAVKAVTTGKTKVTVQDYQNAAKDARKQANDLQVAARDAIENQVKATQAQAQAPADPSRLVTDYGSQFYTAGLVRAYQSADNKAKTDPKINQDQTFYVRGQENPVFTIDKDGKFVVTNVTGATAAADDVRMFGSLSKPDDVPARKWNANDKKFEANPGYQRTKETQNAWRFDVEGRNNTIKQSVTNKRDVTLATAIAPDALHLNHVQYGRVTANTDADAIAELAKSYKDDVQYHQFSTTNKLNEKDGDLAADFNQKDTTIDYYFARGLEPTKKMPTEGTVKYLGHALTYGLDNSFHGGGDPNNANAVATNPRHAIGNFVAATLDTATKEVKGSIYNVWTNNASNLNEGVMKDDLVTFEGKVQGNTSSVLGDAKLAYTPKVADTPTTASFRGGFFGDNASELAGNINTTKEGYGDTAWGAVFGAKSIVAAPGLPFENQAEAQKTAPATPAAN